jgi:oligoribonuclease
LRTISFSCKSENRIFHFDPGEDVKDWLIWLDLEMTGLDPERHVILEIATVVTDGDLNVVAEGPDVVVRWPERVFADMDAWSARQHRESGLLDRARNSPYEIASAEKRTMEFVGPFCKGGQTPLCGNSIWQDRRFLIRYMPKLETLFHYRNVDVSSVKELVRRWYPRLPRFEKKKPHAALEDILESIDELRYYRERVFLPAGGIVGGVDCPKP